jgi:exosortase E/protease (VPEID-CTERM system)
VRERRVVPAPAAGNEATANVAESASDFAPPPAAPCGPRACLFGLLGLELVVLAAGISTEPLERSPHAWAQVLAWTRFVPPIALATITAALLFGRRDPTAPAPEQTPARRWWFAAWNVIAFAVLYWASMTLFLRPDAVGAAAGPLLACWTAAALGTLLASALALHPSRVWRGWLAGNWRPAAGCLALGGLAWLAGTGAALLLWRPLSNVTFAAAGALLGLATNRITLDAATLTLGTEDFAVQVARECSGFEGIGLVWVFVTCHLWLFRATLRFPHALLLLPAATLVMWGANVLRVAVLVALGSWVSPDVAAEGFHSVAGVAVLCATVIAVIGVSRRLPFFQAGAASRADASGNPTAAHLLPLLVLVGGSMLVQAFALARSPLALLPVLAGGLLAWRHRRQHDLDLRSWSAGAGGLGLLAGGLWLALAEPRPPTAWPTHDHQGVWLALRVTTMVTLVPWIEELAFRGYLLRRLGAANFTSVAPGRASWPAVAVTSLLFGALHDQWLCATLAGAIYAGALARRGRLVDAVLAHAATNVLLCGQALLSGDWSRVG